MKPSQGTRLCARRGVLFSLLVLLLSAGTEAGAQYRNDRYDRNDGYGIRQSVARISYISGSVSYNRGDDPDNWQPAALNFPMTLGDRVYSGRGSRMELQTSTGTIFLSSETDLASLNLTDDVTQFSIAQGTASFRIRRLREDQTFEVDTPNAAITFESPGVYRVDVGRDGTSYVRVLRGRALVAAGGGEVPIRSGDEMDVWGVDRPEYEVVSIRRSDSWDRWVDSRAGRYRERRVRYASEDIIGVDDLDEYGRWEEIPQYGTCWTPSSVSVSWAPYQTGRWTWVDPWGWTWVDDAPWGWAPFHYGRWVSYRSRWYWVPERRATYWSPALVAFVGGGPGWSASVSIGGGGFVGWFPLGPQDPLVPWWVGTRRYEAPNATYANRSYVTVVNQNVFVSGGFVQQNVIRDPGVLRQVNAAQVMSGPLPMLPTSASIRMTVASRSEAPRPPIEITSRAVVTRLAPPPAPPPFTKKLEVIRENGGAPVAPPDAAKLAVETVGARAPAPVRPVAPEPGRMTLVPRGESKGGVEARPVTAEPRGKEGVVAPSQPVERRVEPQLREEPPARPPESAPKAPPARRDEAWRENENGRPVPPPAARPPVERPPEERVKRPADIPPQQERPAARPPEERQPPPQEKAPVARPPEERRVEQPQPPAARPPEERPQRAERPPEQKPGQEPPPRVERPRRPAVEGKTPVATPQPQKE